MDSGFRKILIRLSQTREPVAPDDTERAVYDLLFARRYLEYVYSAKAGDGYVITAQGRELVSPHRQGARP